MKNKMKTLIASSLTLAMSGPAFAAVSADEAAKLGNELTRFGAIVAGNAEGTIPPYEGGLSSPPEGITVGEDQRLTNPFADEEPLFRITADNMAEYEKYLTESQMHLLETRPDYYMDVYPTHRTASYPDWVLENTVRNATACSTVSDGLGIEQACRGGLPFPIPKTGNEAMWNMLAAYNGNGSSQSNKVRSWAVDAKGRPVMASELNTYTDRTYYQLELDDRDPNMLSRAQATFTGPAREIGRGSGTIDFLNPTENPRYSWSYTPGQRRVRRAPEFAYDTPNPASGGGMFFDETFLFSGTQDRFDFELAGKEEKLISYSNYDMLYDESCSGEQKLQPQSPDPKCERWELHRVWVVEATLKDGMRHAYSKRRYYWDEDAFNAGLYEAWDQSGELARYGYDYNTQRYDANVPSYVASFVLYDFSRGGYYFQSDMSSPPRLLEAKTERELSPANFAGSGIR